MAARLYIMMLWALQILYIYIFRGCEDDLQRSCSKEIESTSELGKIGACSDRSNRSSAAQVFLHWLHVDDDEELGCYMGWAGMTNPPGIDLPSPTCLVCSLEKHECEA